MIMKRIFIIWSLFLILALMLLAGCASSSGSNQNSALSADNINLIFVVSPDLAYHAPGDINPDTANLTNQGLQRSLLMATYLKKQVLGTKNVTRIYVLEPMTHLQTANNYPDMAAIGYIQQFALLNQITLTGVGGAGSPFYTANSFPLNASPVTSSIAKPLNFCPDCQGLDFNNTGNNNDSLVAGIIAINASGFYVFSAPWETISALMANINAQQGYNLNIPASFQGPNLVYAISITPKGFASLITYNSNLNPLSTYPVLPAPVAAVACPGPSTIPQLFNIAAPAGVITAGINTNQTMYLIRHAEAHPWSGWDDGNFVAAGQWRALAIPDALRGKISPTQVYSIDPAQVYPGAYITAGNSSFSYVRPSLTAWPYAIANNLPYYLVSEFEIFDPSSPAATVRYFFFDPKFSGQTILLAWEHAHFPPIINALLGYYPGGSAQELAPDAWPGNDYDTIWTVKLDAYGNLTVDNALCEGIDSATLSASAPQF
jgi:hypothetical protein